MTRTSLYGRQLGDFRILDCLDEGGFGSVYRCEQPLLGREAVVKVMHQRISSDPEAMRRFSSEARLAARLEHPYAAHVYAHGVEEDGLVWIAMELVHGVSLRQHLDDHGPIPLDQFVPLFERLAEVVHAAHEQGIVHRDLKPGNIMVNRGSPKLLDFGVAKLLGDTARETSVPVSRPRPRTDDSQPVTTRLPTDSLTPRDCVIGTPAYSSPEIWLGHSMGPPTDIYALGVIAFEALTGRRPFRAESYEEFRSAHLSGRIPSVGPMLPRGLDAVFQRALAKRSEDRYDTAIELAAALRGVLDGQRRRRSARRMGAWIGALVATLVFAGGVWRAQYERRLAEQRAAAALEVVHATALTAAVEQGRAALLAGDMQGAQQHLGQARAMGDQTWTTRFMFDRAMQPAKAELAKLQGHGRMWSASWSPDGRWIVTADDQAAELWDGDTYQKRATLPHGDTVYSAAWMGSDRVVTACGDGAVRVWDVQGGKLVRELRVSDGSTTSWRFVVASGHLAAAVDAMGTVAAAWNVMTGQKVDELALDGSKWPSIAFSADGRFIAASGGDSLTLVDVTTWRRTATIPGPKIRSIAWHPSEPQIAIGSAIGDATIWIAPVGARLQSFRTTGASVDAIAWSPDGTFVAMADRDGTMQTVDAAGSIIVRGREFSGKVMALSVSPDGSYLLSADANGNTMVSDARNGMSTAMLGRSTAMIRAAQFSPSGKQVIAAGWEGTARVWSSADPYHRWRTDSVSADCDIIGDPETEGAALPVACPGQPTRVWDTVHGALMAQLPSTTLRPAVSRSGDRTAIAREMTAELYALPSGRLLSTIAHDSKVTALTFSANGELVSGDANGVVMFGKTAVARIDSTIDAIVTLPGSRIAVATANWIRVIPSNETIDIGAKAYSLKISPDGQRLLVVPGFFETAAYPIIIDTARVAVVDRLICPKVYGARWTPSGPLTAHTDGTARLWSLNGALRRVYGGATAGLVEADITPDGAMVAGVSGDGMLYFWDVVTAKTLWAVRAHRRMALAVRADPEGIVTRALGGEVLRLRLPGSMLRP